MVYQGVNINVIDIDNGILECIFDAEGSVNKFDQKTFVDFDKALAAIKNYSTARGLLITSTKKDLLVGADINEFLSTFALAETALVDWIKKATDHFDALEDLPIPTVVCINGFALGGGCEFALSCDFRIADTTAKIGLPEVKLGIMPGFGGTVRLPRLIGLDNAVEWITTASIYKAEQALDVGVLDAVVAPDNLKEAALTTLKQAISGKLNWQQKRAPKLQPLLLNKTESFMSMATCKAMVLAKAGMHYPAPLQVLKTLQTCITLDRHSAMLIENQDFSRLAKTKEATAQVGIYLADQTIKGKAKQAAKVATKNIEKVSVLGAGIMGGGIAYQSAYKNIPTILKDITQPALTLGIHTASDILTSLHAKKRISLEKLTKTLTNITPTLSYHEVRTADIIIEAVVENIDIKSAVLYEVEKGVTPNTIITSNTSTISINALAKQLERKENFCGMHFFNPVHKMPLVEVIRGKDTSNETIANVVAYATKIGKSAIVVNDCPGFYVNRVLFPYLAAFSQLLLAGKSFTEIDSVMEKTFGWPMGPAFLLDVVGIDTAFHCTGVMQKGFPERMQKIHNDPVALLFDAGFYGKKSSKGFYLHAKDKSGKPTKKLNDEAKQLVNKQCRGISELSDDDIVHRLMIPMVIEVVRCLEENIIETAYEADIGLVYGLGFPPFRGGPIRYLENMGLDCFIQLADSFSALGALYQVTDGMREMAESKQSYFTVFSNHRADCKVSK